MPREAIGCGLNLKKSSFKQYKLGIAFESEPKAPVFPSRNVHKEIESLQQKLALPLLLQECFLSDIEPFEFFS